MGLERVDIGEFTNGQIGSNSAGNDGAPARFTPTAPGCHHNPDGSVPGFGGSTDGIGTQGWMFIQRACLTW